MQQGSRYLRKMAAQMRNREVTVLHHALPYKLNRIIIDEGLSPTALIIIDTLTTFGKWPTPSTRHLLTHDVRPIDLTELTIELAKCFVHSRTLSPTEPRRWREKE
ncbi:uncharacterized protein TNCV_2111201 [Trichonephila clavipes]|nr:uncharacterized protein TNCV_2111201 [Trichonephila clavipes]